MGEWPVVALRDGACCNGPATCGGAYPGVHVLGWTRCVMHRAAAELLGQAWRHFTATLTGAEQCNALAALTFTMPWMLAASLATADIWWPATRAVMGPPSAAAAVTVFSVDCDTLPALCSTTTKLLSCKQAACA